MVASIFNTALFALALINDTFFSETVRFPKDTPANNPKGVLLVLILIAYLSSEAIIFELLSFLYSSHF
ncbi:hypothetical protein D3C72_1150350 [compost metagenome]